MPRKKRQESETGIYHWIVRGMNRKVIFHQAGDYEQFRKLLVEYKKAYQIEIFHYCFMTNHVHLLVKSAELKKLSDFSHYIQRRYAYYYCGKYKWSGSVFQRGYRSFVIDREEYLLECGRYIERNPLKAGLSLKPEDYSYSSHCFYALGTSDDLLNHSPAYLALSNAEIERRRIYGAYVQEKRIQDEMREKGLLPIEV